MNPGLMVNVWVFLWGIKTLKEHVDDDDKIKLDNLKGGNSPPLKGNLKNSIYINESGLYALIMASKLPTAKAFRKWVTSEVLPTIRKTGSYSIVQPLTDIEERKLKLEERKIKVAELQILKDLMNIDNAKIKQCMVDEVINILQPTQQRLLTCENTWSRDIVTLCKEELDKRIDFSEASKLGIYIKKRYVEKYGKSPDKYDKFVNGNTRKVNAYPFKDEKIILKWITQYYA